MSNYVLVKGKGREQEVRRERLVAADVSVIRWMNPCQQSICACLSSNTKMLCSKL